MKAILVIDMPNCCTHCRFCNDETGFCKVLSKWVNNVSNTRDYHCPLKPMPKRKEKKYESWQDIAMFTSLGWNMCIDEILGDEE